MRCSTHELLLCICSISRGSVTRYENCSFAIYSNDSPLLWRLHRWASRDFAYSYLFPSHSNSCILRSGVKAPSYTNFFYIPQLPPFEGSFFQALLLGVPYLRSWLLG
ncbi:uncharacterized protein BDZ99DRAFT_12966 [Mytilinidion resinicola]|uniref:Uncharacterized protein n=1 Tax=Mytilinidion resinicola TaxID=574789 RepID=A0A6A6ZAH1_9PEZI|nr:uncharacterized protein BDZ99DRAFT_12966 [Mytilinidion resinicola]KAF2817294.1 hypothetical protein BDZ99DRAFT_12966 [Mytilinidion resinicola]